jgi:hypothetical protein
MQLRHWMPTRFWFFAGCVLAFLASAAAVAWQCW